MVGADGVDDVQVVVGDALPEIAVVDEGLLVDVDFASSLA